MLGDDQKDQLKQNSPFEYLQDKNHLVHETASLDDQNTASEH
jgi:hypothetical protein